MRNGSRGGLVASKGGKARLNGWKANNAAAENPMTLFAIQRTSPNPLTKRANEYATPTHNVTTTKVYSVSLPVGTV